MDSEIVREITTFTDAAITAHGRVVLLNDWCSLSNYDTTARTKYLAWAVAIMRNTEELIFCLDMSSVVIRMGVEVSRFVFGSRMVVTESSTDFDAHLQRHLRRAPLPRAM